MKTYDLSPRVLSLFAAAGLLAGGLSACGPDGNTTPEEACKAFAAGDLVITEFLSDPNGVDTGQEYFEIYNATSKEVDLKGLVLYVSKIDGSKEKTHKVASGKVKSNGYFVFGDAVDPVPSYVNYSYGKDLGPLPNDQGLIGLRCGKVMVDEVKYTAGSPSGYATILSGALTPASDVNDIETNFCAAEGEDEFLAETFGSPGRKNAECPTVAPEGSCLDAATGEYRPVVSPAPGDLVITEFMADPSAVSDTSGEWFEVFALAPVDLNGLSVSNGGTSVTKLNKAECMRLGAGQYALLARKSETEINGGLPQVTSPFSANLSNSNGAIMLSAGDVIIDKVTYLTTKAGKAWQLDPTRLNATANDDINNFCEATDSYGAGDFGTPGAANKACPTPPDPNSCTENGAPRAIVPPAAGDIVITEFMPDPSAVSDTYGEWIELFVKRDVDLNGLEIRNEGTGSMLIASSECKHVAANTHIVIARNADPAINGGIESVFAELGFSLSNSGAHALIVQRTPADATEPVVFDRVDYTTSKSGQASALDINKYDSSLNDDPAAFCYASATYGAGDKGTPGAANEACEAPPAPNTCSENGSLRPIVPPAAGDIVITEFMADPSAVSDTAGEWIELFVTRDVDLNGVEIKNEGTGSMTISSGDCKRVAANTHIVLARSVDPTANGGIQNVFGLLGLSLSNTGDHSIIVQRKPDAASEPVVLDRISYSGCTTGASTQLDVNKYDVTANDAADAFCVPTATYGAGDRGTPGLSNEVCAQ